MFFLFLTSLIYFFLRRFHKVRVKAILTTHQREVAKIPNKVHDIYGVR